MAKPNVSPPVGRLLRGIGVKRPVHTPTFATSRPHPATCTKTNEIWLPWQLSLRDRKTNLGFIVYRHSSTNPENSAKIGPVDSKIGVIGLTGIVKNK